MEQLILSRSDSANRTLSDGDLVVARKAGSALDKLIGLTADPFHHIGIIVHFPVEHGEEPWVIEHTFAGCTARTFDAFVENYDDVGLLRLSLQEDERSRVRNHATKYLGSTPRYAWDEVFLVGMNALARERRHTKHSFRRGRILTAIESAVYKRNISDERSIFCTSFVLQVFRDADLATENILGPLAPPRSAKALDLSPTRKDKTMHWPFPAQIALNLASLVSLLVRSVGSFFTGAFEDSPAMCSPSDFWRQVPGAERILSPNAISLAPVIPMPDRAIWRDDRQRDARERSTA